jgi:hypothetical protein
MKTLQIYRAEYGTAFFENDKLIQYIHENDGDWRSEYFNRILEHFDVEIKVLEKLNETQEKLLKRYES